MQNQGTFAGYARRILMKKKGKMGRKKKVESLLSGEMNFSKSALLHFRRWFFSVFDRGTRRLAAGSR